MSLARFRQCAYEASSGVRCPKEGWHVRGATRSTYFCTAHATWWDKYIARSRQVANGEDDSPAAASRARQMRFEGIA